jgi:hypothetical protein
MVQYCCAAAYKGLPVSFNNVTYITMNDIVMGFFLLPFKNALTVVI